MDSKTRMFYILLAFFGFLILFGVGSTLYFRWQRHLYKTKFKEEFNNNNITPTPDLSKKIEFKLPDNTLNLLNEHINDYKVSRKASNLLEIHYKDSNYILTLKYTHNPLTEPFWAKSKSTLGKLYYQNFYLVEPFLQKNNKNTLFIAIRVPDKRCEDTGTPKPTNGDYKCFYVSYLYPKIQVSISSAQNTPIDTGNQEVKALIALLKHPKLSIDTKQTSFILSDKSAGAFKYSIDMPFFCDHAKLPGSALPTEIFVCNGTLTMSFALRYDPEWVHVDKKQLKVFTSKLGNIIEFSLPDDPKASYFSLQRHYQEKLACKSLDKEVKPPCASKTLNYKKSILEIKCLSRSYDEVCQKIVSSLVIE